VLENAVILYVGRKSLSRKELRSSKPSKMELSVVIDGLANIQLSVDCVPKHPVQRDYSQEGPSVGLFPGYVWQKNHPVEINDKSSKFSLLTVLYIAQL
jgi:hypothetical protein